MRSDPLLVDDGEYSLQRLLTERLGSAAVSTPLDEYDLLWYGADGTETHLGERKTASDLLASITDGRLLDETERAHAKGAHLWLFISGEVAPWRGGVRAYWGKHKAAYQGVTWEHTREFDMPMERVQAHLTRLDYWCGVHVVRVLDDEQMADVVARLYKERETPPVARLWRPGVELMRRNPVAAAYMTYEGVGEVTALALAAKFPNERSLARAKDKTVLAVAGVGPKRLAAIRRRLNE